MNYTSLFEEVWTLECIVV